MASKRAVVILAAGKGKRMKSDIPKVLHQIKGKAIIQILLDTLTGMDFDKIIVVIGHKGEMVEEALNGYPVSCVWQREQLGTGHAVMMAAEDLKDFDGDLLVALGDVPFLSSSSIDALFKIHEDTGASATCLSAILKDATGYGRIVRIGDSDLMEKIVEHRDANENEKKINEINSGLFCFNKRELFDILDNLKNDNSQGEYYLTDSVKIMNDKGLKAAVISAEDPDEVRGINSVEQLQYLEERFGDRVKVD